MVSVFKALVFLLCVGKHFSQELFAVIGGASCAENLFYGPQSITETGSADGNYPFFLSTSTASKDVAHSQWLQIVTSDGVKELFRIYWTFNTKKTLAARFAGAVSAGEVVDYEVVVAETGASYSYSGFWRFSSNAAITANIFATPTTQCCFSADDGVWGAGIGTIDGDGLGYQNTLFWGQGNWDTSDSACKTVFRAGEAYTEYVAAKSFMYYYATPYPTAAPTLQPTIAPTVPGDLAGNNDTYELFAVVGGYSCAEALYYGPQAITLAGSADGNYPYFLSTSTASRDIAHREWLQIVTMEGGQTELFRIYWTFTGSAKTLAQRIIDAVRYGEDVDYLVLEADTGAEYRYSGKWWFSDASRVSATTFNTATTQCCFSADDGVWGAGTGHVDGDGSTTRYSSINFWGVGNWESTDFNGCFKIFKNGVAYGGLYGDTTKSFMYYDPVSPPSPQPTEIPTAAPSISFAPTHFIPLELFAVVGGAACAENLYYGAQAISTAGSADGKYPFFLSTGTPYKDLPHREWMQIVTTDGVTEIMRIYWTFSTLKTLADRFVDATTTAGEDITYRVFVAKTGQDITLYGRWRFSSTAHLSKSQFETNDAANCCFSVDDGAWGAATGTIDANTSPAPQDFWGQGNFDSSDSYGCRQVYMNGVTQNIGNRDGKSYFYYSSVMEPPPTMAPTFSPADLVYFRVQQVWSLPCNSYYFI